MARLISWNVNGLRAVYKKGFLQWVKKESPDILCLQETKAELSQLPQDLQQIPGYHTYYSSAERKGYSGVALFSKTKPESVSYGFGVKRFDVEGRMIRADYGSYILYNVYFPNGSASSERLKYKLEFYEAFLNHIQKERDSGASIIFCGDVNTAHKEIDIARPRENEGVSGFLPVERAWIDAVVDAGYLDTFRMFELGGGHYSWWDYKTRARDRNVGWRLDYFFASEELKKKVSKAYILSGVAGSDHCPVALELID